MTGAAGLHDVLDQELAVARAAAEARAGDLDGAARRLDALAAPGVAALDLRARVHAQRGELAEADACWSRVQRQAPEHAGAAAGRIAVAGIVERGERARPRRAAVAVLAVAVLAGAVLAAGALAWPVGDGAPPAAPPPAAAPPSPDRAAPSAGPVADAPPVDRTAAVDALADRLAAPGLTVQRRSDSVLVVFDAGLFVRSDRLTPAGTRLLRETGARLAGAGGAPPDAVRTRITGHVVAVPGGPQEGGSVVGLARALTAARDLAAGGGPPLTSYSLASADQADGPHPDAARNRTVTLEVAPSGR